MTMNVLLDLNLKQKVATRFLIIVVGLSAIILAGGNLKVTTILALLIYYALRHNVAVFAFVQTIGRDFIAGYRFVRFNIYMTYLEWQNGSVVKIFHHKVARHPQKSALIMGDRSLTFQAVSELANQVGAYFKTKGLKHGDCVALVMETCTEYPCMWLGLSQIGVITALININQRRETLIHSIKVARARAIIVSDELASVVGDIMEDETMKPLQVYQFTNSADDDNVSKLLKGAIDLGQDLADQPLTDLTLDIEQCKLKDKLMYVYTSGTTGLPKAAVITNRRYMFMASGTHHIMGLTSNDVVYNSLPLYHTAGGIIGIGNCLVFGCTVVIRKKFSASNFWKDCIKYNCTAAQYIGELCRYLLNTPPKPEDTQHHLRLMFGNGLRAQIWSQFVSRFNIPNIGEFYGSTEGNSNLANITNKVGAVGFIPIALQKVFPVQLVRCEEETGEPIRDKNDYCISCADGETGLLIGKVNKKLALTSFSGYADKQASEKKLLKNVFVNGDVYFNSGDMVVRDILGYIYFKDRTGDTFRWRGENVATLEVEAIITNVVGLQDCVVYGVSVPHVEGKAGMAAIVDPQHKIDFQHLSAGIRGSLPAYAQPLFIRIMDEIPRTGTFKMKKLDLVLESFDIHKIKDPIYYLNKDGNYRPLTPEQFELIQGGKAGL